MNHKILVIIVTWNGMKWIRQCLESLRSSTFPIDIFVVDNGSTDETVPYIRTNYPEVEVMQSGKNLGFGQANNIGFRKVVERKYDYAYLLNQDAYVFPDMFERLLEVAEKNENTKYAILSPMHVHGDGVSLDEQFKGYLIGCSAAIVEDLCLSMVKDVYPVDCVPAAGWLMPAETIKSIGAFDPIFFHYGEDHQYAQRVKYHGFKIGIVPSAKMIHDRDGFGNSLMANSGAIERSIKTEILLNINLSRKEIIRKLTKLFFLFSYESFRCAFKGDFRSGVNYFYSFFACIPHLKEYKKNREDNRNVGSLWL